MTLLTCCSIMSNQTTSRIVRTVSINRKLILNFLINFISCQSTTTSNTTSSYMLFFWPISKYPGIRRITTSLNSKIYNHNNKHRLDVLSILGMKLIKI